MKGLETNIEAEEERERISALSVNKLSSKEI